MCDSIHLQWDDLNYTVKQRVFNWRKFKRDENELKILSDGEYSTVFCATYNEFKCNCHKQFNPININIPPKVTLIIYLFRFNLTNIHMLSTSPSTEHVI